MTNRSARRAATRADVRRRSRRLAQGQELDGLEEEADDEPASAPARGSAAAGGSFLTRLFPPVPALPGKPDPLATFTYQGPFRTVASWLYILRSNPRAWLLLAIPWFVAQLGLFLILVAGGPESSIAQIVLLMATIGTAIAAGWIGWQRPWLFGLAVSIVGTLVYALVLMLWLGPIPSIQQGGGTRSGIFVTAILNQAVQGQWLFGIVGGWYGGYLRRRSLTNQPAPRPRRR